jgi:hypothetical protein
VQDDVMDLMFNFQGLQLKTAQTARNTGLLCVVLLRVRDFDNAAFDFNGL